MPLTLSRMMPMDLLIQLLEAHDLSDDDDKCPLCLEKYLHTKAPAPGIIKRLVSTFARQETEPIDTDFEIAVRLPCQHVLGLECMKRWVSPIESGQNTCPYCIQPLFTPSAYPVSTHLLFYPLLTLLSKTYGLELSRHGLWFWNHSHPSSSLSAQDLMDATSLYAKHVRILEDHWRFLSFSSSPSSSASRKRRTPLASRTGRKQTSKSKERTERRELAVRRIAIGRISLHLLEAVLYLQLQTWGVTSLTPIKQTRSEAHYSFFKLEEEQVDKVYEYFEGERRHGLKGSAVERFYRAEWEVLRSLEIIPNTRWNDLW